MNLGIGDFGAANVQQCLIEEGYALDEAESSAGHFGPTTLAAIEDFQSKHVDRVGQALTVDGIVGAETLYALLNPAHANGAFTVPRWVCHPSDEAMPASQILAAAVQELGTYEIPDGTNRGPKVDEYTKPDFGIPWCAAFVSYVLGRTDDPPFKRILSAKGIADWGQQNGRKLPQGVAPLPGDVFVILRAEGHGHTGFVASLLGGGEFCTVEGNSGNAVRGLIRNFSSIACFVRTRA